MQAKSASLLTVKGPKQFVIQSTSVLTVGCCLNAINYSMTS